MPQIDDGITNKGAYAEAGVDVTRGYRAIDLMRSHVARTCIPGVIGDIGGFGGLFDIGGGKLLAAGADGVGTKLRLAIMADKHDTVGIDCVAMSVNDVVCCGARPLFFLDYIASGKTDPERVAALVAGVAEGCVQAGCALLGGETAEMPGFYAEGDYDLAGFAVGVVDANKALDRRGMREGDAIIALPSAGVHSNGFSLIRNVFSETVLRMDTALTRELLTPTRIYVKPMTALLEGVGGVRSAAHITGGGFFENIPRALAAGYSARIDRAALRTPEIFRRIARHGRIDERDMFGTFNMGAGMIAVVAADDVDRALRILEANGSAAYVLGEVVDGEGEVLL